VKRGKISITPVKRATFVINTDGTLREVIKSEVKMDVHADRALESLKAS
jgi:peroxiredoxin Q/BCP